MGNDIELLGPDSKLILDEKLVLIGLLQKQFFDNLNTQKFPSPVISVRKEDILNIQEISSIYLNGVNLTSTTIDLSKLERLELAGDRDRLDPAPADIKIEGLSSLKFLRLEFYSLDQVILNNLLALNELSVFPKKTINSEVLFKFNDYLPNIEMLELGWNLSYLNLDSFSNLKSLRLFVTMINDDFNFDLFNIICNQLENIVIHGEIFDDKCFYKLFNGRNFPYLSSLFISQTTINKFEKKMFNGFPMLQHLLICIIRELKIIDYDAFSNLIQLNTLSLLSSYCIESIDNRLFSNLVNLKRLSLSIILPGVIENFFSNLLKLECLYLGNNQLKSLDPKSFVGLNNLKILDLRGNKLTNFDLSILDNIRQIEKINLSGNPIINKEEILSYSVSSKIKFIF